MRNAGEMTGMAIVMVDPDWRVIMMNIEAEELLGVYEDYAIGKPFHALDLSIEVEGPDAVLYARGGRAVAIVSGSDVLDARGHIIFLRDITMEREARQKHAHGLTSTGEMPVEELHKLMSPLLSIELYANILAKELEGTPHIRLVQGIFAGTRRLNNVLTVMHSVTKSQENPLSGMAGAGITLDEAVFMLMPFLEGRGSA